MTVIVMARETGPRGDEIAAAIAERLDLELVSGKDLARAVAHGLRLDEPAVQRVVDGSASWLERWTIDRHRLCQRMGEEALRLAARQNVLIQDCGAACLLRPVTHVISVVVWAPARIRFGSRAGRPRFGEARKNLMARWDAYDLAINAERLSVSQCVEQVARLARNPQFQPTATSRDLLARLVRDIDRAAPDPTPEWTPRSLDVEVGSQTIRLAGMTSSEEAIAGIEHHLHGSRANVPAHSLPPNGGLC
jgi:cytidylate kinase